MTLYSTLKHHLIGELRVVANQTRLIRSSYVDSKTAPTIQEDWVYDPKHPVLAKATHQLNEYLRGDRRKLTIPLQPVGTDFQLEVWNKVLQVPIGSTISYGELAKKLKMPKAARSIGAAIGKNPLLIFIPDHRVVNRSGAIGGFAGHWNRKPGLLELEAHLAKKHGRRLPDHHRGRPGRNSVGRSIFSGTPQRSHARRFKPIFPTRKIKVEGFAPKSLRIGLAEGESKYDDLEKRLAEAPVNNVPTITLEGDANGAPHPDATSYAKPRERTEGNTGEQHVRRTLSRVSVYQRPDRVRGAACVLLR
jgi:methylated-DNA-[protein]-cysteine S-methyltransferase